MQKGGTIRCGPCHLRPWVNSLGLSVLATDNLDVTAAKADIVKLAVRQLGQGIAGGARIIPRGKHRDDVRHNIDGTVGGDGAEGRRAGRLDSGHGFHPCFHIAQIGGLFLHDSQIVLLQVQSKSGPSKAVMQLLHD